MDALLILGVVVLAFANGANDNFKGVATIWGARGATYGRDLLWATAFTLLGSLAAFWFARELAAKFNGSVLLPEDIYIRASLLAAVSLGAAVTVLLATRSGLPVSTTHALTGALAGTGLAAAGLPQVNFAAFGGGILLPLLITPVLGLGLTVGAYPMIARIARKRDCLCVEEKHHVAVVPSGTALAAAAALTLPAVRRASAAEFQQVKPELMPFVNSMPVGFVNEPSGR